MTTTVQQIDATNKYLWTYTIYTYGDNHTTSTDPVITGVYGDQGSSGDIGISIEKVIPIWYASSSNLKPNAPTGNQEITSTSAAGGAWRIVIPEITTTYPYLYTCNQIKYSNGTYNCTTVIYDSVNAGVIDLKERMTQAEQKIEDDAIVSTVMESAKYIQSTNVINLLPSVYYTENESGNTWTNNGITWTVNRDGSITANGTATAESNFILNESKDSYSIPIMKLDMSKKYTLSGCPSGGSSNTYWIKCTERTNATSGTISNTIYDYGNSATITPTTGWANFYCTVKSGVTVSNIRFYPMLEVGEVKHDYVSTHNGTGALTTRVQSAESSITQQAGLISSKVSQQDYNGETIASLINQSADTVSIHASHIQLEGVVTANGYFKINEDGTMQATGAKISGNIEMSQSKTGTSIAGPHVTGITVRSFVGETYTYAGGTGYWSYVPRRGQYLGSFLRYEDIADPDIWYAAKSATINSTGFDETIVAARSYRKTIVIDHDLGEYGNSLYGCNVNVDNILAKGNVSVFQQSSGRNSITFTSYTGQALQEQSHTNQVISKPFAQISANISGSTLGGSNPGDTYNNRQSAILKLGLSASSSELGYSTFFYVGEFDGYLRMKNSHSPYDKTTVDIDYNKALINGLTVAYQSSSSRRYKHNIAKITNPELDPHRLYDLPVVQFYFNENHKVQYEDLKNKLIPGIIAEDVAKFYPSAVIHDDKGEIESWDERRIIPGMLQLIQELHNEVNNLSKEIKELKNKKGDEKQ